MFFDRFVARLLPHSSKKGQTKDSQTRQAAAPPNKAALLKFSKNLNSIKELNIALEEIDQAIEGKSATNQQLLLKAEIFFERANPGKQKNY